MAGKRQERVNIALEFLLSYVIIYDNIQTKDGENMEELRQRRKIISQLVEARLEKGISQAEGAFGKRDISGRAGTHDWDTAF